MYEHFGSRVGLSVTNACVGVHGMCIIEFEAACTTPLSHEVFEGLLCTHIHTLEYKT